jgi:hypothetical protein
MRFCRVGEVVRDSMGGRDDRVGRVGRIGRFSSVSRDSMVDMVVE